MENGNSTSERQTPIKRRQGSGIPIAPRISLANTVLVENLRLFSTKLTKNGIIIPPGSSSRSRHSIGDLRSSRREDGFGTYHSGDPFQDLRIPQKRAMHPLFPYSFNLTRNSKVTPDISPRSSFTKVKNDSSSRFKIMGFDFASTRKPSNNPSETLNSPKIEKRRTSRNLVDRIDVESQNEKRIAKIAKLVDKETMVLNPNQLMKMQPFYANHFTISVHSTFRHTWDFIVSANIIYVLIVTPVRVSFHVHDSHYHNIIDATQDFIFLMEIIFNLFTSYEDEVTGEEIMDLKLIRRHYIHGWFLLDVLSGLPFSLLSCLPILNANNGTRTIWTATKLLRVSRVAKVVDTSLYHSISEYINRSMNPAVIHMIMLVGIFIISQHFLACIYQFYSTLQRLNTAWEPPDEVLQSNISRQYINALYFAMMVTTGNNVEPKTEMEQLVTLVMLFIGIMINASIIGSAANLLANLDKHAIERKNKMDNINDYLRFKKVPFLLREKILKYYDYTLSSRLGDPTETIFAELPQRLKISLRLNLHDDFIQNTPIFKVCSSAGVVAIVQSLKSIVVMPMEIIISQSEVTSEFYLIKKGVVSLSVIVDDLSTPLGNIGEGSFFGEYSLLTGRGQEVQVKAEVLTELLYLEKKDFHVVIDKSPNFYLAVKHISQSRMQTVRNITRMGRATQRRKVMDMAGGQMGMSSMNSNGEGRLQRGRLKSIRYGIRVNKYFNRFIRSRETSQNEESASTTSRRNLLSSKHLPHDQENDDRNVTSLNNQQDNPNNLKGLRFTAYLDTLSLSQAAQLGAMEHVRDLAMEEKLDDDEIKPAKTLASIVMKMTDQKKKAKKIAEGQHQNDNKSVEDASRSVQSNENEVLQNGEHCTKETKENIKGLALNNAQKTREVLLLDKHIKVAGESSRLTLLNEQKLSSEEYLPLAEEKSFMTINSSAPREISIGNPASIDQIQGPRIDEFLKQTSVNSS